MGTEPTDRKWEKLPVVCLTNIFGRVGLESLVERVPYVCKPWYKATLSPLCWQSIVFPDQLPVGVRFLRLLDPSASIRNLFIKWNQWLVWGIQCTPSAEAFVRFVIRRSHGSLTVFDSKNLHLTDKMLKCIADGCPNLKRMVLPRDGRWLKSMSMPSGVICKWKNLEALEICNDYKLEEIIPQISTHCKKFVSLSVRGFRIEESDASVIANLLPNIEFLCFKESRIVRSSLVIILIGCKKLLHLEAVHCYGAEVDDEIQNLAAHIPVTKLEGLKLH